MEAWKRRRPSCHQASERRPSHELERSGRLPLQLGRSQQSHLGWRAERCASPPRAERHGSSLHNVGACRGRRGKHGCTQNPDRKSQNPESGIQTKPDKHKWPSFYPDIRTQNPESGIRNPDPSSPHEPACMEGHQNPEPRIRNPETRPQPPEPVRASKQGISEPRTRIPETGFGFLILGFHTCWRGPCNDYQNPESKTPKISESIWILGGAIHGPQAGKSLKNFARCARRQIFNQIFENMGLPQL